jgi:hypothetical protein
MARLKIVTEYPVDEAHERQFFEYYGRAMLSWQSVELELFFIFHSIIRAEDHRVASGAYHARALSLCVRGHKMW